MTRTDVMASSRPFTAGESRKGLARVRRALVLIPVLALLAAVLAGPGSAIAAEGTSGYSGTPTTPSTGTSPSKETSTPASKEEEPAKSSTSPSKESSKSGTLPFTGFDLRWSFAIGVVLMGAGFSIIVVQRRARRGSR